MIPQKWNGEMWTEECEADDFCVSVDGQRILCYELLEQGEKLPLPFATM